MVSSILKIGDKLEIKVMQPYGDKKEPVLEAPRAYKSVIYDIMDNGDLEIGMPIADGKLILLSLGLRYEMVFYTKEGLYHSIGQVNERYKRDNLYMVSMELKKTPSKIQRREYYRLNCLLDVQFLFLSQAEGEMGSVEEVLSRRRRSGVENQWITGMAVDISGGGMRFITREDFSGQERVIVKFSLQNAAVKQEIQLSGTVLSVQRLEESSHRFECRVKFDMRDDRIREQIIKYIFAEERKSRNR